LKITMEDTFGLTHEQYYSAGDPEKIVVSPDGKRVDMPNAPDAKGLVQSTNAIAVVTSIINAGFPEDRITDDVSVFDGLVCRVNQIAQPKRPGLKDQKDRTYLMVTKILRLPWESAPVPVAKGAPSTTAKGAPTKKAAPALFTPSAAPLPAPTLVPTPAPVAAAESETPVDDNGLRDKAKATILQILAEKGGTVAKAKLPTEAFRALSHDSDRNAVVTLVFQEPFLRQAAADGTFSYDGTTVSFVA
jgi:hypothetical protein